MSQIDTATGASVDRVPVGGNPASIACGEGSVWVANTDGATVLRLNPTTGGVTQRIPLAGGNPDALTFGAGRLWVADSSTRALYALDPTTVDPKRVLRRTIPLRVTPSAIAFGAGALWVAAYDSATVVRVDPAPGRHETSVHVGTGPDSLAFADGDLWVANSLASTVSKIDPASLKVVATIPVGSGPSAVIASAASVWVANQYSGSVSRIDPRRDTVVSTVNVGGMPTAVTAGGGRLWVGIDASGASHRGGTLRIASTGPFASIDPAIYDGAEPPQFGGLTYDTLVTFDHTGGVDGLRLVPDLALTLPTPTDGRRAYTFHLRPGIRYSNGTPVRAGDFRRAIERLFRVGSSGGGYYTDIVGASACIRRPSRLRPRARNRGGRCERDCHVPPHRTRPRVPLRTDRAGLRGANTTRNTQPRHGARRDPRHRAIPDRARPQQRGQVRPQPLLPRVVTRRSARREPRRDHLAPSPDQSSRGRRSRERACRLAPERDPTSSLPSDPNPIPGSTALTRTVRHRIPPLQHQPRAIQRSVLVRRALNYAIDRNTIVRMYGGPAFATPTCQPLTPGMPGYVRYCPYTLHPRTDGAYSGPNLHYAKRLVARSGTRGDHITVWGSPDEGFVPPRMPFYIASVLRSLGYRATVRLDADRQDHDSHVLAPPNSRRTATGWSTTPTHRPTSHSSSAAAAAAPTATCATPPSTAKCDEPNPSNRERRPPQTRSGQPSITPSHTEPTGCRP